MPNVCACRFYQGLSLTHLTSIFLSCGLWQSVCSDFTNTWEDLIAFKLKTFESIQKYNHKFRIWIEITSLVYVLGVQPHHPQKSYPLNFSSAPSIEELSSNFTLLEFYKKKKSHFSFKIIYLGLLQTWRKFYGDMTKVLAYCRKTNS